MWQLTRAINLQQVMYIYVRAIRCYAEEFHRELKQLTS